jgi:hypothetical protein
MSFQDKWCQVSRLQMTEVRCQKTGDCLLILSRNRFFLFSVLCRLSSEFCHLLSDQVSINGGSGMSKE